MPIDIKKVSGLSSQEVAIKLASYGFNELPAATSSSIVTLILKLFREPMFLLLLVGATLYFILGSRAESLMLLSFVVVMMGISCYQEYRSEKSLITLRNLSSPRAFVIRDDQGKRIAGCEVVPEDIIVLREGDVIPADARLLAVTNLLVDESILTGESDPVRKVDVAESALTTMVRPGGDDLPFVYAGTKIIQGSGYAQVVVTGANTEIGRIGKTLNGIEVKRTLLQQETDRLVRKFAIFGFIICALVAMIYGITRLDLVRGLLVGITLAMAILPEELPVVITVFWLLVLGGSL